MTRRGGQEGAPLWRGTLTAPPCRPAGQGQTEAAGESSDPHSDPETRRVGPWRERSCRNRGPESLPPKPLLSYVEPQAAETSPGRVFPERVARRGTGWLQSLPRNSSFPLSSAAPTPRPPVPMGSGHRGVWGRPGRGSGSDCGGRPAQPRGSAAEWEVEAPSLLGHPPPNPTCEVAGHWRARDSSRERLRGGDVLGDWSHGDAVRRGGGPDPSGVSTGGTSTVQPVQPRGLGHSSAPRGAAVEGLRPLPTWR